MRDKAHRFGPRGLRCIALLSISSLAAALSLAATATAGTVTNDRPLLFSFDGSGTTLGPFTTPGSLAVDEETGGVYVVNLAGEGKGPGPYDAERVICKFDAEGNAQNFAALGKSCLDGSETPAGAFGVEGFFARGSNPDIAVDNSGGAGGPGEGEQGRLYVSESGGPIHAFDPGGSYLWTLPRSTAEASGIAVDGDGHLWVIDTKEYNNKRAREFDNSGSPPSQLTSFALPTPAGIFPAWPAVDRTGNTLYLAGGTHAGGAAVPPVPEKWVGGAFDSLLTAIEADEIAVDQSSPTGHVFTLHREGATGSDIRTVTRFTEFDSSGVQLGSWGDQDLGQTAGAGYGRGIAYNPSLDRVYVSDLISKTVKVFGPPRSGTVPDVAIESSTAITRTTATANGTIDPQSLPNGYRFQWAVGGNEVQHLRVNANAGTFTIDTNTCCPELSEAIPGCCPDITDPLPFDVSPAALQTALEGLAPIGPGNVSVTGTPGNGAPPPYTEGHYDITFSGALAGVDVNQLWARDVDLEGQASRTAQILTTADGPDWGSASSSPTQSIEPPDGESHQVSFGLSKLKSNTTYQVRLVGTNSESKLATYSVPDTFTTLKPPLPAVSIDSIDPITTSSAHVEATIDPQEDTTTWRVQKSTDPSCAGGFLDEPLQTITEPGPGAVAVQWDLTGLLPAQTYCVRLAATNGGGTATADKVIQTLAIPPSGAKPAFVAPLTDTTARLNARVNPEGEADITYHFELSEDGANWTVLPDVVSSLDARESIVIAEEVDGLKPNTTYNYRLGALGNSGGPAASLGEARTFTTLTTAEATLPPNAFGEAGKRGIELVNSPDKGNQNVFMYVLPQVVPYISADGERARWTVLAGAPGATSGAWAHFLAERSAGGWQSRSIQPPAAEQFGEGAMKYSIAAGPPDLSGFIVDLREQGLAPPPEATIARLDTHQHEEVLRTYTWINLGTAPRELGMVDATEDGAHVLTVDTESTRQLEDIGDGAPETVSLMPDGTPSGCGLETVIAPSFLGGRHWRLGYHMMATTDASIVYFRARPNGQCVKPPWGLYVRDRDAKKGKGETTPIDFGTAGVNVEFIRASEDGLTAFFTTASKLDPADANAGLDLYRWDHKAKEASCLTCVVPNANLDPAGNEGMAAVMVSDDLSHAYFQSTSQLVAGEGVPGAKNLYALSEGELRFVAALGIGGEVLHRTTARLSAEGNVLLFRSEGRRRLSADAVAANGEQLYRYDDRDRSIECLSCAHGALTTHAFGVPSALNNGGAFRLSADGSTAGFVTAQALTPLDVNGDSDVYEWRNGSRRLLTDGLSDGQIGSAASGVWGIDADGSNILFSVVAPNLTGFELDDLANLYVARIGGGFVPPAPPVHCVEDSCQGPLVPPPDLQQPASSLYTGAGNQESGSKPRRPCAKKRGKAKRRCIRRHKRRSQARASRNAGRSK